MADEVSPKLIQIGPKGGAKRTDLIVFNDVSRGDIGFDTAENEVVLVSADGERRIQKAPKERIASEIVDEIVKLVPEA